MEDLLGHFANAIKGANRQRTQELDFLAFANEREAIRFLVIAGDLGEQFVGRNADGGPQLPFRNDAPLQLPGERDRTLEGGINLRGRAERRNVEIGFINRNLFDGGAGFGDQAHDLPGLLPVLLHSRPHENAFGTKPAGRGAGHGGTDAEFAGLIAGGTNDAALHRRRSNDDGLAAQRRVVTLLDRSVKGVHVQMEDDAKHRWAECHNFARTEENKGRSSRRAKGFTSISIGPKVNAWSRSKTASFSANSDPATWAPSAPWRARRAFLPARKSLRRPTRATVSMS